MGSSWELPWPTTRIDKEDQLRGVEITLPKLSCKYGTFQVRRDGTDRIGRKKYNNRVGKQTDLGDLEIHLWRELVKRTIEASGEKELYKHLLAWEMKHNYAGRDKEDLEDHTMELFAFRIFDNPLWVDFVPFNRKYRPEYLESIDMVTAVNTCCSEPYQMPRERLEQDKSGVGCCGHCGRHTPFKLIGGQS